MAGSQHYNTHRRTFSLLSQDLKLPARPAAAAAAGPKGLRAPLELPYSQEIHTNNSRAPGTATHRWASTCSRTARETLTALLSRFLEELQFFNWEVGIARTGEGCSDITMPFL